MAEILQRCRTANCPNRQVADRCPEHGGPKPAAAAKASRPRPARAKGKSAAKAAPKPTPPA